MMGEYNINQTTLAIMVLCRSNYRRACYLREIARDVGIDVKAVQISGDVIGPNQASTFFQVPIEFFFQLSGAGFGSRFDLS